MKTKKVEVHVPQALRRKGHYRKGGWVKRTKNVFRIHPYKRRVRRWWKKPANIP